MSDWTKVNTLLGVIHNAAGAGPKFVKWAQKANDELDAHWAENEESEIPPAPAPVAGPSEPDEPNDDVIPNNGRRL